MQSLVLLNTMLVLISVISAQLCGKQDIADLRTERDGERVRERARSTLISDAFTTLIMASWCPMFKCSMRLACMFGYLGRRLGLTAKHCSCTSC